MSPSRVFPKCGVPEERVGVVIYDVVSDGTRVREMVEREERGARSEERGARWWQVQVQVQVLSFLAGPHVEWRSRGRHGQRKEHKEGAAQAGRCDPKARPECVETAATAPAIGNAGTQMAESQTRLQASAALFHCHRQARATALQGLRRSLDSVRLAGPARLPFHAFCSTGPCRRVIGCRPVRWAQLLCALILSLTSTACALLHGAFLLHTFVSWGPTVVHSF